MNELKFFNWSVGTLSLLLVLLSSLVWATTGKIYKPGSTLPAFELKTPDSPEARKYLGLNESKTFTLSQIPSKFLLVEFFSFYCPVCQRQAPKANKIYKFIKNDESMSKDIKVLGIGVTNKQKEVDIYRKTFRVEFPLFADADKENPKKTGIEDIPLTVLIDKNGKVLISHLGIVKDVDNFLREIRNIQKEH